MMDGSATPAERHCVLPEPYRTAPIRCACGMTPEQKARRQIDHQLGQCGWDVQDYRRMNISAGLGVAVREFPLSTGDADYLLYVDGKACGVVEAIENKAPTGKFPEVTNRVGKSPPQYAEEDE